jgi:dTMP kinase
MKTERSRGCLITFEGPEGSGKSTHSRRLAQWLKRRGYRVVLIQEPGGTPIGRRLRKILLDSDQNALNPFEECLLYEASRSLLVRHIIRPALQRGCVVVLDRFQDSTWVYQGWAGGVDIELVDALGSSATGGIRPDLTFLMDLPVRKGLLRVKRPNRMEAKSLAFHAKVRAGYLALARRDPTRFRIIRTDRPMEEVIRLIREEVQNVLR